MPIFLLKYLFVKEVLRVSNFSLLTAAKPLPKTRKKLKEEKVKLRDVVTSGINKRVLTKLIILLLSK